MKESIMKNFFLLFFFGGFWSCEQYNKPIEIESPNGIIGVKLLQNLNDVVYEVFYNDLKIISKSKLDLIFDNGNSLFDRSRIKQIERDYYDETWELSWGEVRKIRNQYNQIKISFENSKNIEIGDLIFRVYDDGIAFRYYVRNSVDNKDSIIINNEVTQFNLVEDAETWWIPAYEQNRYEYLYKKTKISGMDTVHTPLTIRYNNGIHLSIHEAALTNYSSMQLFPSNKTKLNCDLAPWSNGDKVRTITPFHTPWRTITIKNTAKDLITSYLTLNCNEPSKIKDNSWIKPAKYIGIWWGMIIGKWTWGEGPRHGATTERGITYVDFASKYGIDEVLIEGWQSGFKGLFPDDSVTVSFTKRTPDFDMDKVQKYAQSKGISLQAYHETSANTKNYLAQLDTAFSLLSRLGIKNVKIGQVGHLLDKKEFHYGQYGVDYYRKVLEKAVQYKIGINFHEPVKDTGERRTYPNMLTREGARGMEYNAWPGGNPPGHTTILPFTRLLNSPMDYTPGIFDLLFNNLDSSSEIEFPVTFTVVDSGNGYNDLFFISQESFWQHKPMTVDTIFSENKPTYISKINQNCQAGEWEWGVVADHTKLESYNIWLPELIGDGSNRKFKVSTTGQISGQTTMVIPSNKLDLTDVYHAKTKNEIQNHRISTTISKQLALYVVINSPLQMAADFIENYTGHPAFQFIRDVPVSWDTTIAINGQIGEYLTIARKDRNSKDWYVGAITNEDERLFDLNLSFLDEGLYEATIYSDTKDSDWEIDPYDYNIYRKKFTNKDSHQLRLANGGGQAIRFTPIISEN